MEPLVAALRRRLRALEKKPWRRNDPPSQVAQDLACQIQSGAQRGEQLRREVANFAEGTMGETAAVTFANTLIRRILNPMATKGTTGCHEPPNEFWQDFARAFVARGWTDKLLRRINLNTVFAAMRSSSENAK